MQNAPAVVAPALAEYELIDYGSGLKFERFGSVKLIRPEPAAQRNSKTPVNSRQADSVCTPLGKGRFSWTDSLEPWVIRTGEIKLQLRLSHSQNIGIFPEQESNWHWLSEHVKPGMKILNLFAYTGAATLVCAKAGAAVCHVDASKAAVRWASENAKLNSLEHAGIRWIVDDALEFLRREHLRGKLYDGVLLDPPPFGRAAGGEFLMKRDLDKLMQAVKAVLSERPKIFLLNSYAMNLKPAQLAEMVKPYFKGVKLQTGELRIGDLPLSSYVRISD